MRLLLMIMLVSILLVSCRGSSEEEGVIKIPDSEQMEEMNRQLVQKDRERIESYIERKKLIMTHSPLGFWYHIADSGRGENYKFNDRLLMEYKCFLLDGTLVYSSDLLGQKEVVIGKSDIESGLDHALRLLRPGAEAKIILPPFLAHGLLGDGTNIPARAVVVYELRIVESE